MSRQPESRGTRSASTRKDERRFQKDVLRLQDALTTTSEYTIVSRRRSESGHLLGQTFRMTDALFEKGWFVIGTDSSHTFYIIDQKTQIVRQTVRICLFADMSAEEYLEYQRIASHWRHDSLCHGKITSNGAAKKGGGRMYAAGWRTGYENYNSGGSLIPAAYGSYAKDAKIEQDEWFKLRSSDHEVHSIYGRKFRNLLPQQFATQWQMVQQSGLPMLGTSVPTTNADIASFFGPTATYTFDGFFNALHVDKDSHNHMAFGVFLPICYGPQTSFNIASVNDGYRQLTGGFINAAYKTIVDFASIDGAVEMAWWGSADPHCTLEPEWLASDQNQTHLGSSIQVSQALEHRIDQFQLSGSSRLIIDDVTRQRLKDEGRL